MPNHIQNRLQFIGDETEIKKVMNAISGKYDDGKEMKIDFNKIKPMPKGMETECHSGITMWVEICTGQLDFACLFQPMKDTASNLFKQHDYKTLSSRLGASTALEHLTGQRKGNVKDFSEEEFTQFIQCLKNYREHGATTWYEWSKEHWGTKWNAYEQGDKRDNENTIHFQTAWSSPVKLILELSKMFPDVILKLDYADEDSGSNTGRIVLSKGEVLELNQPENSSNEAYELCFELHPHKRERYKMVDGKYQYVEED